jgi:hypothetical protein
VIVAPQARLRALSACAVSLASLAFGACPRPPAIDKPNPIVGNDAGVVSGVDAGNANDDDAGEQVRDGGTVGVDGGPLPDAGEPADAGTADPLAAYFAMPPMCSPDGWCWKWPTPQGNDFIRVFTTSDTNIWLTARHGVVLQWDGTKWTSHHPPVPAGEPEEQFPFSIGGLSSTDMWLIFANQLEHWDGTQWTIEPDVVAGNGSGDLFDNVWEAPNGEVFMTESTGFMWHSVDGISFAKIDTGCNCFLGSIFGTSATDVFMTSLPGIVHYDGSTFHGQDTQGLIVGSYQGVANDIWVAGEDNALLHYDGSTWTPVDIGLSPAEWTLENVSFNATNDVWWWADRSASDVVALLHWDGTSVHATPIDATNFPLINSIAVIDDRWWLVGGSGSIFTKNGFDTTPPVLASPGSPFGSFNFGMEGMWGSSDDDMYFAVDGQLYHYDGANLAPEPLRATDVTGRANEDGSEDVFAFEINRVADGSFVFDAYHFDQTTWSRTELTEPGGVEAAFIEVVIDAGVCVLFQTDGLTSFIFENGVWTPIDIALPAGDRLTSGFVVDSGHVVLTGSQGPPLFWDRSNPNVTTPDATFPALGPTDEIGPINGAGGTLWAAVATRSSLFRSVAGGPWVEIPGFTTGSEGGGVFGVDASTVLTSSAGQSLVAKWVDTAATLERTPNEQPASSFFQPPGGTLTLWGAFTGVLQKQP